MSVSLYTTTLEAANELEAQLREEQVAFERRKGIRKLFYIYNVTPEEAEQKYGTFAKDIVDIEELTKEVEGIVCQYDKQDLTLDLTTANISNDSWGIARVCRRDMPWPLTGMSSSINTSFESIRRGEGVDIYVLDSADFAMTHPDLINATDLNGNRVDIGSSGGHHGTWCASAAGGQQYGVAKDAHIWCVSTLSGGGFSTVQQYTDAIDDIIVHYNSRSGLNRPAVFSMSIGGFSPFANILDSLIDIGIPVFISAGNDTYDCQVGGAWWPICYDDENIIGVGSLAMDDTPARFSNFGPLIDVWSPGLEVMLADPTSDQARNGTSFSTPMAAGVAACYLQGYNRMTTRTEVLAFNDYFFSRCTQDRIREPGTYKGKNTASENAPNTIPYIIDNNRIVFLDSNLETETIPGLTLA